MIVDDKHYHTKNKLAPVINTNMIRIIMTLLCVNPNWIVEVMDV